MPVLSRFFGVIIFMYWRDHAPPHFHAKYADQEVIIEIESGKVDGDMSKKALGFIQEWRQLHIDELLADWKLAEQKKALSKIAPLE